MQDIKFVEHEIMSGPGEAFAVPITYNGLCLYFGSLNKIVVPEELQSALAFSLYEAIENGSFPETESKSDCAGKVTVPDGEKIRTFSVTLSYQETGGHDDFYQVESIFEQ